jgi:putative SOS response-associated peptidase YedK
VCGRYTLRTPVETLAEEFGITGPLPEVPTRFNVAPTQEVAAVLIEEDEQRKLEMLRWGLIPSWADDAAIGNRMINARSETAAQKPSFRSAFRKRRCLVLADGFYEWQKTASGKQPYYIRMGDGSPFAFAGLWESWGKYGEEVRSCTILTTEANGLVGEIHHRMPVILPAEEYDLWLDPDMGEAEPLLDLLRPYPDDLMEAYPVSRFVNSPSNDSEQCVESLA